MIIRTFLVFSHTTSVLDLTFATKRYIESIITWQINEEKDIDLNYKIIQFFLLIKKTEFVKSFFSLSFNINKADWKLFKENLKREKKKILNDIQLLLQNSQKLNLERAAVRLKKLLLKVI